MGNHSFSDSAIPELTAKYDLPCGGGYRIFRSNMTVLIAAKNRRRAILRLSASAVWKPGRFRIYEL